MLTEITLRQGSGGQAGVETTYYHYDGCGNTTAKQEPAGTTYYQYDTENLGSTQACSSALTSRTRAIRRR